MSGFFYSTFYFWVSSLLPEAVIHSIGRYYYILWMYHIPFYSWAMDLFQFWMIMNNTASYDLICVTWSLGLYLLLVHVGMQLLLHKVGRYSILRNIEKLFSKCLNPFKGTTEDAQEFPLPTSSQPLLLISSLLGGSQWYLMQFHIHFPDY